VGFSWSYLSACLPAYLPTCLSALCALTYRLSHGEGHHCRPTGNGSVDAEPSQRTIVRCGLAAAATAAAAVAAAEDGREGRMQLWACM